MYFIQIWGIWCVAVEQRTWLATLGKESPSVVSMYFSSDKTQILFLTCKAVFKRLCGIRNILTMDFCNFHLEFILNLKCATNNFCVDCQPKKKNPTKKTFNNCNLEAIKWQHMY